MRSIMTLGLVAGIVAQQVPLAHADRTIVEHLGALDPAFAFFTGGQPGTAVLNDLGLDAWNVVGPFADAFPRFQYALEATDITEMRTTGFRATATLRNKLAPDDAADLGNFLEVSLGSVGQWSIGIGADELGDPIVLETDACCLGGTPFTLDPSVVGSGYHEYQLLYNPHVSTSQVELLVDDISHGLFGPAASNFGDRMTWGSSDRNATWDTNWHRVSLETDLFDPIEIPTNPLVGRHQGMNNPNDEGWSGNGAGTSAVLNDMGFDAWKQTDPGAFARYNRGIPAEQAAAMESDGWRARARVRNLRSDDDAGDLGAMLEVSLANVGQFSIALGSDADGDPTVLAADACCLGGTPLAVDPAVSGDGYHIFDLLYDPTISTTEVELLIDGIPHGFLTAAASNFGDRFNFGASDGSSLVDVNWNFVQLMVLGDKFAADFNADDAVNALDIDLLTAGVRGNSTDLVLDIDGSTIVGDGDVVHLVEEFLNTNFGDADLNGSVTASGDGAILLANLGGVQGNKGWADADFDGDQNVTASGDGSLLLANLGADASAVPEPGALLLLALSQAAVGIRLMTRRRMG